MKVICIDGIHEDKRVKLYLPEGIILDVYQSTIYKDDYRVVGYEVYKSYRLHWAKRRFIPLSEIDEMELSEANIKEASKIVNEVLEII